MRSVEKRVGLRAAYMSYSSSGYPFCSKLESWSERLGVVSMNKRPRLGGGSRRERGESNLRDGPRGSEAVRTVPSLGSSLFRTEGFRSRRSSREGLLRTEIARAVKDGGFGGEVLVGRVTGLI